MSTFTGFYFTKLLKRKMLLDQKWGLKKKKIPKCKINTINEKSKARFRQALPAP